MNKTLYRDMTWQESEDNKSSFMLRFENHDSPSLVLYDLSNYTAVVLLIIFHNVFLVQANTSVDSFLQSLGLEKYQITFKAEEVCCFHKCICWSSV